MYYHCLSQLLQCVAMRTLGITSFTPKSEADRITLEAFAREACVHQAFCSVAVNLSMNKDMHTCRKIYIYIYMYISFIKTNKKCCHYLQWLTLINTSETYLFPGCYQNIECFSKFYYHIYVVGVELCICILGKLVCSLHQQLLVMDRWSLFAQDLFSLLNEHNLLFIAITFSSDACFNTFCSYLSVVRRKIQTTNHLHVWNSNSQLAHNYCVRAAVEKLPLNNTLNCCWLSMSICHFPQINSWQPVDARKWCAGKLKTASKGVLIYFFTTAKSNLLFCHSMFRKCMTAFSTRNNAILLGRTTFQRNIKNMAKPLTRLKCLHTTAHSTTMSAQCYCTTYSANYHLLTTAPCQQSLFLHSKCTLNASVLKRCINKSCSLRLHSVAYLRFQRGGGQSPFPPSIPSPLFPSKCGLLNPAREPGERCKLLSGFWDIAPVEIELGALFASSSDIWWQKFYGDSTDQIVHCLSSKGKRYFSSCQMGNRRTPLIHHWLHCNYKTWWLKCN